MDVSAEESVEAGSSPTQRVEVDSAVSDNSIPDSVTSLRFLVSNTAAGSVIGKGGSTISEFQIQSGARIQLSRNHEYFPGTTERVVVLNGTVKDILTAFKLILSKIIKDTDNQDDTKITQVKLVVPKSVCGAIIGKGGANIKGFVEDSQASIKLSSQDQLLPGVSDRIVTINGNLEQLLKAVTLIITKLVDESSYSEYAATPLVYAGNGLTAHLRRNNVPSLQAVAYGAPSVLPNGGMMAPLIALQSPFAVTLPVVDAGTFTSSLTVAVPDEHIGVIVGRSGKTLQELQQSSGAKIKVSERGDFVTGTEYRKVTMSGSADAIQAAQFLLTNKIQQNIA